VNSQTCALTFDGYVDVETAIPLQQLEVGDTVLGIVDPDQPDEPRTTHVVTVTLGQHYVPTEDPTILERFLTKAGLERLVAGGRVEGILVNGTHGPGLFALDSTPVLDRVIF
jgi:hypothetical protein